MASGRRRFPTPAFDHGAIALAGPRAAAGEALVHERRVRARAADLHDLGAARPLPRRARPRRLGDEPPARARAPPAARADRRAARSRPGRRAAGGRVPLPQPDARGDRPVRRAAAARRRGSPATGRVTLRAVVWYTVWFLVILKIPVLYLAWVIWWAVKDPPDGFADSAGDAGRTGGADSAAAAARRSQPHRGPDRKPARRSARTAPARTRRCARWPPTRAATGRARRPPTPSPGSSPRSRSRPGVLAIVWYPGRVGPAAMLVVPDRRRARAGRSGASSGFRLPLWSPSAGSSAWSSRSSSSGRFFRGFVTPRLGRGIPLKGGCPGVDRSESYGVLGGVAR